jgi:hypothetical protein
VSVDVPRGRDEWSNGELLVEQLFARGKTSRLHVAHFVADLMTGDTAWNRWKGQMPVIYDEGWSGTETGQPASAR